MAYYEYRCTAHVVREWHNMGEAPPSVTCAQHGVECGRIFGDFQFQADNTRFFRNGVDGSDFSFSLGHRIAPDSKRELYREYDRKGIEPVTRKTMPEQWKADHEYAAAVRSGEKIEQPKPTPPKGVSVLEQLRKSNVRVG